MLVMRVASVGVVEESKDANFPVGTHVVGFGGILGDYYAGTAGVEVLYKAGETGLPVTADLSICSLIIGLTAWYGVNKILQPDNNSIIVVSGAAGAVGSTVGQLAKLKGAKVIGIAGSADKLKYMRKKSQPLHQKGLLDILITLVAL